MILKRDIIIPFLIVIFLTILFRFTNLDLQISELFYIKHKGGFFLRAKQPWALFYMHLGKTAAYIASISLILLIISFFKKSLSKYKKILAFILIALIIGPGLVVHTFKEEFNRPRPRHIKEFGGGYNFVKILTLGKNEQRNASFPSGHAASAFSLLVFYFLCRNKRKAKFILFTSIVYGIFMGLTRVIQGGHFPSDIVWSFAFVYFISYFLAFIFLRKDYYYGRN